MEQSNNLDEGYEDDDSYYACYATIVSNSMSSEEYYEMKQRKDKELKLYEKQRNEYCFIVKMCLYSIDAYNFGTITFQDFKKRVETRLAQLRESKNRFGCAVLQFVVEGALDDQWTWDVEAHYWDLYDMVNN